MYYGTVILKTLTRDHARKEQLACRGYRGNGLKVGEKQNFMVQVSE